jgi:diguanylate cyclase (GGDEF)-like protein
VSGVGSTAPPESGGPGSAGVGAGSEVDRLREECAELRSRLAAAERATREAFQGTARLTRMLTVLSEPGGLERLLDRSLACLSELFDAEVTCLLAPSDGRRLEPVGICGLGDEVDPADVGWSGGAAAAALASGGPVRVDDLSLDPALPPALAGIGVRTGILVPARTDDGATGVLALFRCRAEPFASSELPILVAIAHRTQVAVEQAQRTRQIESLTRLSAEFGEHLEVARVLESRVEPVAGLLAAGACLIAVVGDDGSTAVRASWGLDAEAAEAWRFAAPDPASWEAAARELARGEALLTAPVVESGRAIGSLGVLRSGELPFRARDAHVLKLCAVGLGRSLANAHLHEAIRRTAHHDELTGLPNRRLLLRLVEEELDRFARAAVDRPTLIFVDLDGFKEVNDTLGHQAGDAVLVEVAERLESCIRSDDVLGRLGGDEFVLVLRGPADAGGVEAVSSRIAAALRDPFRVGGGEFLLTASFGVVAPAEPGVSTESLLREADAAMYRMKAERPERAPLFVDAA